MEVTSQLLEEITRRVLAALGGEQTACISRGLLIGGGPEEIPGGGYLWTGGEEYQGDIAPYALVVCVQVSTAQLCDMALGRDDTPATRAVSQALLAGKPVYLIQEGLPHRVSQATAAPSYYAVLEGYVQRLIQYGVQVVSRASLEQCLSVPPTRARATGGEETAQVFHGVLTAAEARRIAQNGPATLRLARGAILTPLARDILRENQIPLLVEEGELC